MKIIENQDKELLKFENELNSSRNVLIEIYPENNHNKSPLPDFINDTFKKLMKQKAEEIDYLRNELNNKIKFPILNPILPSSSKVSHINSNNPIHPIRAILPNMEAKKSIISDIGNYLNLPKSPENPVLICPLCFYEHKYDEMLACFNKSCKINSNIKVVINQNYDRWIFAAFLMNQNEICYCLQLASISEKIHFIHFYGNDKFDDKCAEEYYKAILNNNSLIGVDLYKLNCSLKIKKDLINLIQIKKNLKFFVVEKSAINDFEAHLIAQRLNLELNNWYSEYWNITPKILPFSNSSNISPKDQPNVPSSTSKDDPYLFYKNEVWFFSRAN